MLIDKKRIFLVHMWLAMPEAIKDVVCDAWGPETDVADDQVLEIREVSVNSRFPGMLYPRVVVSTGTSSAYEMSTQGVRNASTNKEGWVSCR